MRKVAILGLGLMGGSLGLAVKRAGVAQTVTGYARREATRTAALVRGAVDEVFGSPVDAVRGADLVVVCVPVLSTVAVLEACVGELADDCIVTDVGSTKEVVVAMADAALAGIGAAFVGSHPIAGAESTGVDAAREDLYEGAAVILTPSPRTPPEAVARLREFWEALRSNVHQMDPAEHDRVLARTSHLPHILAAMLVANLGRDGGPGMAAFCGTGFRDTTRIAGGAELLWHDILKTNRSAVIDELDAFEHTLCQVRAMLATNDFENLRAFLARSRQIRLAMEGGAGDPG